jgi:glutamate-1-semialdehyde aminotransferase
MIKNKEMKRSKELWERAARLIPCGTQTLSKGPDQFVRGVSPIFLEHGDGCRVYDVDSNEYIDYPMALGPIILGYNHPSTVEAVSRQIRLGSTFTLMHPLEVEVAELVVECVPSVEMVRFCKDGSDATAGAVRIARAYTGRDMVAYCGYHGFHDWYVVTTPRNRGIPEFLGELMIPFSFNRIDTLEKAFADHPDKIGTVIIEQGGIDPEDNFLSKVRDLAHKHGAVFIMDEIVTGFRYALGGAQELYGVEADLSCLGKGMANGLPIACLAGKREFMKELESGVFFSMTFGGDTIALAAAKATVNEMQEKKVIPYIWELGRKLHEGVSELIRELGVKAVMYGHPPRGGFTFFDTDGNESFEAKSLFMQETVRRGVLFGGPVFVTWSHTEAVVERTIEVCGEALQVVAKAQAEGDYGKYLDGEPMGIIFRPRS